MQRNARSNCSTALVIGRYEMHVLVLCVAALCLRSPAASRDTMIAAASDTVRPAPTTRSPVDTLPVKRAESSPPDTIPEPTDPLHPRRFVPEPIDTLRGIAEAGAPTTAPLRRKKKVVAVEYSDWYARRLTIHRWASYATLPLFAGNYVTGQQLFQYGNQAPAWAIQAHGPLATSVTTLFAVNTLTGGWNLWEGRNDPNGRGWRVTHALLMLGADAGFATAGILANQAERSDQRRHLHRTIALTSIGVSLASYVMMIPPFRRD
jgi:hypothetical protein